MSWWTIFGIAVGLAMDALAVAIATGLTLRQVNGRQVFRLAWHFGLFQFLMPVVGWLAGRTVAGFIGSFDHWLAFAMLAFIGGRMIYESCTRGEDESRGDPTRGLTLVTLSIATSLDALAVGLTLAFLDVSIWGASVVIGIVAGVLTALGISFGARLGARWEKRAEIAGGIVLIGIGARILHTHLTT